jgi:hypothetical protein
MKQWKKFIKILPKSSKNSFKMDLETIPILAKVAKVLTEEIKVLMEEIKVLMEEIMETKVLVDIKVMAKIIK